MELFSDHGLLQNPKIRRWFLIGLVLLPLAMSASGVRRYYLAEAFMYLRPETWTDIKRHMVKEDWHPEFYRPMGRILPSFYHMVFGSNSMGPRAIQFITYSMTCLLAFLILEALSQSSVVAALGALIFIVMPSHVESMFHLVQTISANTVFIALLVLWLLGPGYKKKPSRAKIIISCIAYVFGVLTYPIVILTPVFLFIYEALWGLKEGFAEVKKKVLKCHLPLWIITALFVALRLYQLSLYGRPSGSFLNAVESLTIVTLMSKLIPIVYATLCPLQLSPALSIAALLLLYFGFKGNWRFTLFLLLFTLTAPAFSYPQTVLAFRRIYLTSFGTAGLLAFVLVYCLGGLLDTKKRSGVCSVLDWVVVVSIWLWVLDLLRVGWAEFFKEESPTFHLRWYAALIAASAIILRWVIASPRTRFPKLSELPLKSLSIGLAALIVSFFAAGFLNMLSITYAECDQTAVIPTAIVAARPSVPANPLILVLFDKEIPPPLEDAMRVDLRGPLRAEYGTKDIAVLGFGTWVRQDQYKSIPADSSLVAFRFTGDKAAEDPKLARRVLARQKSYLELNDDVVHAESSAEVPASAISELSLTTDPMMVDTAEFDVSGLTGPLTAQFELVSDGKTISFELPAIVQDGKATVRLNREPKWLLADAPQEVRTRLVAGDHAVPVKRVALLQTKGLVSETPLEPPPESQWMKTCPVESPLAKVRIYFRMDDLAHCVALP